MKLIPTAIADLIVIEPQVFGDERGFFLESWNAQTFADAGLDLTFVQDNHSRSAKGVLRGLHYQNPIRRVSWCASSRARRLMSPSTSAARRRPSGSGQGVTLTATNKTLFWVPPGFAHGFLSLEDGTDFLYKCTEAYAPADEHSVLWNDPAIGIEWPLGDIVPQLSAKDKVGRPLAEAEVFA